MGLWLPHLRKLSKEVKLMLFFFVGYYLVVELWLRSLLGTNKKVNNCNAPLFCTCMYKGDWGLLFYLSHLTCWRHLRNDSLLVQKVTFCMLCIHKISIVLTVVGYELVMRFNFLHAMEYGKLLHFQCTHYRRLGLTKSFSFSVTSNKSGLLLQSS